MKGQMGNVNVQCSVPIMLAKDVRINSIQDGRHTIELPEVQTTSGISRQCV